MRILSKYRPPLLSQGTVVNKLCEERRKIVTNVNKIKIEYSRILKDKAIDEHSILSKLKETFERKNKIEYIQSLESKVIDEPMLTRLKEFLEGENERKDEIRAILSKLKEIPEGNIKESEIKSILLKLKEILERNIEEEPIFEKVLTIEEEEGAPNTDNTNVFEIEENNDDAELKLMM
jgi:hypothetical protein